MKIHMQHAPWRALCKCALIINSKFNPLSFFSGYTDATLTFGATITTQVATVYIFDDSVVENTEFINLTLSSRDAAAILNPATASVSIEDGDSELTITTIA